MVTDIPFGGGEHRGGQVRCSPGVSLPAARNRENRCVHHLRRARLARRDLGYETNAAQESSLSMPRQSTGNNPCPTTTDGRYFVVRGRLWRTSNPALTDDERKRLVDELMSARRTIRDACSSEDAKTQARHRVHTAKVALGERGPPGGVMVRQTTIGTSPKTLRTQTGSNAFRSEKSRRIDGVFLNLPEAGKTSITRTESLRPRHSATTCCTTIWNKAP